jgi:hypothetical protein
MDRDKIGSLAALVGDEAHKARTDLHKWFDSLVAKEEGDR